MMASKNILAVLAFAAIVLPTSARAQQPAAERDCNEFVDHATARIQAGEIESVRRDAPRLKLCQGILKAAVDRAARQIVKGYDDAMAKQSAMPAR